MPSERIQLFIDLVTGQSQSTLSRLTTDLKNTEGAFNKAKVAGAAVGDFLKRNLALGAAAAGTAIVGFGVDAAKAFTEAGRAAGLLRDQTKLTAEEASRLAEVGADIGIPVETLATAIGRMNRAAESTPAAFSEIGASLRRAKDGSLDVQETFLNTIAAIGQIPDAARQAEAAQKIFGRGWQSIAELISMGAEDVRAALEGVSDAQVFDDAEIAKAREMHARLEDLQDQFLAVQLAVGEFVVDFADGLGVIGRGIDTVYTQAKRLATLQDLRTALFGSDETFGIAKEMQNVAVAVGDVQGPVKRTTGELEAMAQAYREAGIDARVVNGQFIVGADAAREQGAAMAELQARLALEQDQQRQSAEAAQANADAHRDAAAAAEEQTDAFRRAADAVYNQREAHRQAQDAIENVQTVIGDEEADLRDLAKALDDAAVAASVAADADVRAASERAAAKGETIDAARELRIFNDSLLEQAATAQGPARDAIVAYIATVNGITEEKATEILALIDQGKLDEAERKLNKASEARDVALEARAETAAAEAELAFLARDREAHIIAVSINRTRGGAGTGDDLAPIGGGDAFSLMAAGRPDWRARARSIAGRAREDAARAADLREQAAAIKELADATKDEAEAKKLLEEREKKLDKARDLSRQSSERAQVAARMVSDALREQADAVRDAAAEWVDAQRAMAEADRERSASLVDAVDAVLALEDARASAVEAFAHAARAFSVEGVTAAQRAAAVNDAQQAALALARAQVAAARERAEARGQEFSGVDAAREMQRALQALVGQGGPVGEAIRQLIQRLDFPSQVERERSAIRRDAAAERHQVREDRRADKLDRAADRSVAVAEMYERLVDKLIRAMAEGASDARIRAILREITRQARSGRR